MPELADDLGGGEVAVEALLARRTKGAVERAADLARDAQRAAAGLGDEYGLDSIAAADFIVDPQQPLARAIGSDGITHRHGAADFGFFRQFGTQRLGDVGHPLEVVFAETMHPAQHLARTEGLLAPLRKPGGQTFGVEIEQIDH